MASDPEYDKAFRMVIVAVLSDPPAVCAFCGLTQAPHMVGSFLGSVDHYFERQSVN